MQDVYTDEFTANMNIMQVVQPDAYSKLCQAGTQRWSRAHCPLVRYNYMTSNSVESVNACSVINRKLPVLMLAETYRAMLQEWYFKRQKLTGNMKYEITDWAAHKVHKRKLKSATWIVHGVNQVSKLWKFTIDSSIFIRDYGSRQCETCCFNLAYKRSTEGFMCSVDEQMSYTPLLNTNLYLSALTPITTSEGVWCFSYGSHMGAILWNPSIRKSIGIVIPYMTSQPEIRKIVWGFGVRSDTLDPTFLNISMGKYGAGPWHVFVYTLSSNSWNSLENYRLPRVSIRIKRSCGQTTVSGFIFWGGYEIFFNVDGSCYNISMLVSFDMINHQFHVLDIPSVLRDQLPDPFYISHLGNSLVISGNLIIFENRYICAWLLEVDGYNVTSWRMLFVIPSTNVVKLIGFTKDDDPIVEVDRGRMLHPLQVYDRASEEFHNVGISADGGSFFIGPYKESLILLNV
ncbi:hypothetical protein Tco_0058351 [Tanacetum coccineum]